VRSSVIRFPLTFQEIILISTLRVSVYSLLRIRICLKSQSCLTAGTLDKVLDVLNVDGVGDGDRPSYEVSLITVCGSGMRVSVASIIAAVYKSK
jgi:hypothetical protein